MSIPYENQAGWSWPNVANQEPWVPENVHPGEFREEEHDPEPKEEESNGENNPPKPQRVYPSRTCRICLEEVLPSFETPAEGVTLIFHPAPKVAYISADPSSGRLIRPCKCRGSQAYVHEGCLQGWRHADPRYGQRNFWECPTCKFRYRLERMRWSRYISSTITQVILTIVIMLTTVFVFGFIADPIINLYLDPYDTITSTATGGKMPAIQFDDEDASWAEHFLKGLASLGLLGFVKVFFAMSPWHWWNLRQGGLLGGGRRGGRAGTGRERLENISWTVVVIGVITFLIGVWSWVRVWSRRTLEKAGERVADVQGADDDEEFEEQPAANRTDSAASKEQPAATSATATGSSTASSGIRERG